MILWTIQKETVWTQLQKQEEVFASSENILENSWLPQYNWMIEQMKIRIGAPPKEDSFPIWAWYQWKNAEKKRPDLRANGYLDVGENGVRIEFECEESGALLSDFELWHFVLNYWYLPESEKDGDEFEAELKSQGLSFYRQKPLEVSRFHEKIESSWNKIFDIGWHENNLASPSDKKSIQATLWQLKLDQVRDVTFFKARSTIKSRN